MTKEEAIARLKRIQEPEAGQQISIMTFGALEMAIKALEQQPCEDDVEILRFPPNVIAQYKAL